jgi:uncharacterized protein (TIGR00730 family)
MGLRRVCVFCGSSTGRDPAHAGAVERLAVEIVSRGAEVVYGGGGVGLMGVLADAALRAGGHVIGVIPEALVARELAHRGLPDLRIVASMHERKATMAELSDAFVAAPGGFGTFEELCEAVTWTQLGLHRKRCGLLNVAGFFDPLLRLFDRAVQDGFIRETGRAIVAGPPAGAAGHASRRRRASLAGHAGSDLIGGHRSRRLRGFRVALSGISAESAASSRHGPCSKHRQPPDRGNTAGLGAEPR